MIDLVSESAGQVEAHQSWQRGQPFWGACKKPQDCRAHTRARQQVRGAEPAPADGAGRPALRGSRGRPESALRLGQGPGDQRGSRCDSALGRRSVGNSRSSRGALLALGPEPLQRPPGLGLQG